MSAGLVGLDSAGIIATMLHELGDHVDAASKTEAEADLTARDGGRGRRA